MTVTTDQNQLCADPTTPAVTPGVEQYLRFLQRQAEINRQVALSWANVVAAVAPIPGAVIARALSVENRVTGEPASPPAGADCPRRPQMPAGGRPSC